VAAALAALVLLAVAAVVWQSGGNKADSIGGPADLAAVPAKSGAQPIVAANDRAAAVKQMRPTTDVAQLRQGAEDDSSADDDSPPAADNAELAALTNPNSGASAGATQSPAEMSGPDSSEPIATANDKHDGGFAFALKTSDIFGKTLDLASLRGKVVLVDLWGTWCPPCRKEIPHLVQLKTKFGRKGLEIVGVNFERVTSADAAIKLVRKARGELKINYRCVLGTDAIRNQIPDFRGYPTMLILARDGQVHSKLVGYHSYEQLEEIVTPLLAEKTTP
jgi:thiol-disulfide isomerase/thioredoxin